VYFLPDARERVTERAGSTGQDKKCSSYIKSPRWIFHIDTGQIKNAEVT
jgi:hypothetical protein